MRSDAIRSTFGHVVYPYNEKQNGLSVLLSESSLFKGAKNEKYDQMLYDVYVIGVRMTSTLLFIFLCDCILPQTMCARYVLFRSFCIMFW